MKYPVGTVLFCVSAAKSGKIIRLIQRETYGPDRWYTEVNHVAVVVAEDLVRNAVIPRSKLVSIDEFEKRYTVVRAATPTRARDVLVSMWSKDQQKYVGQWYGLPNIVGFLVWILARSVGVRVKKNPIRGGRICTEDVAYAMQDYESAHCHYSTLLREIDKSSWLPADLGKYVETSPLWALGGILHDVGRVQRGCCETGCGGRVHG